MSISPGRCRPVLLVIRHKPPPIVPLNGPHPPCYLRLDRGGLYILPANVKPGQHARLNLSLPLCDQGSGNALLIRPFGDAVKIASARRTGTRIHLSCLFLHDLVQARSHGLSFILAISASTRALISSSSAITSAFALSM